MLKQTPLAEEHPDVVKDREDSELPVNSSQYFTFHVDDEIFGIPPLHHIVKCISSRILDLQVLGGDQETAYLDEDSIVLLILGDLRRV